MDKLLLTNGAKSVTIQDSWDFVDAMKAGAIGDNDLYAKVAAVFRAVNLSANAVAYMPFALVDKGGKEYDVSWAWENKVGYMPRPKDILRRIRQSLIMSNMAYLRMGKNKLKLPKQLNYVVPTSIEIWTDPVSGELLRLDRRVNGNVVKSYVPDDNELIRFWWLDEKTELLPSPDTEFKAIMQAAGILYYSDYFTRTFYERGGIKPTLIAMKGMVSNEKKEDLQKDWTKFVKGIGQYARNISAKIFNAEAMTIQPFGDGLGDLKETPVYKQALESIAIGMGMPLSILLSNSANKATADTEYIQWYRDEITPRADFIADILTEQVFMPLNGLRMEYRPEYNDVEQEGDSELAAALSAMGDAIAKYSDAETFLAAAGMIGYELTDEFINAVTKYYANKKVEANKIQENMKPAEVKPVEEKPTEEEPEEEEEKPVKWIPNVDEVNELRVWRDVAIRRWKRNEGLDFEYQPHYGGLPDTITDTIKARLTEDRIWDSDAVKRVFEIGQYVPPVVEDKSIMVLAEAINRLASRRE